MLSFGEFLDRAIPSLILAIEQSHSSVFHLIDLYLIVRSEFVQLLCLVGMIKPNKMDRV